MAKKKKPNRPKKILNPFLLSIAGGAAWAATHSPPSFTAPEVIGAWLITALAVGLIVRALLALISPIIKIIGDAFQHDVKPDNLNDQNDAGS